MGTRGWRGRSRPCTSSVCCRLRLWLETTAGGCSNQWTRNYCSHAGAWERLRVGTIARGNDRMLQRGYYKPGTFCMWSNCLWRRYSHNEYELLYAGSLPAWSLPTVLLPNVRGIAAAHGRWPGSFIRVPTNTGCLGIGWLTGVGRYRRDHRWAIFCKDNCLRRRVWRSGKTAGSILPFFCGGRFGLICEALSFPRCIVPTLERGYDWILSFSVPSSCSNWAIDSINRFGRVLSCCWVGYRFQEVPYVRYIVEVVCEMSRVVSL